MKLFTSAFILFIAAITNINAQFVGSYSLKDGGVDIQSSSLFVLPDHTFIVFYAGGTPLQGNWTEESKDKIKLEINTENKSIFSVYAIKGNPTNKNVQFSPSGQINLYVSVSKNKLKQPVYQPLFDEKWGCLDRDFETNIADKKAELKLVSPEIAIDFSDNIKYPVASNVYTFQLSDKFSNYRIFIDPNVKAPFKIEIIKQNEKYIIQDTKGGKPIVTDRDDIAEEMITKIKAALMPWQINDLMRKGVEVEMLNPVKVEKTEFNKPTEKPLFIAKCEQ
ncbi:hypothetical protein NJT12_01350 [Flavobacterium sp. AC]|uniref:GLPGLI family protein n=1 Tax=Flavobacterium azizsancarii TaxID=2961580 RepID=A0ABT4W6Q4_9FLAO|nr:hypothetical protein [Flavobacterium azizsancarii]MDA6068253.1 hypothetical protein [Flavobacterium azizsancarii]